MYYLRVLRRTRNPSGVYIYTTYTPADTIIKHNNSFHFCIKYSPIHSADLSKQTTIQLNISSEKN